MANGKYALVTGASSGIGRAMAKALASKGNNLILVARRNDRLQALKKEIEHICDKVDVVIACTDLSVMENCKKLVEDTKIYKPHIVINNAGFGRVGFFTEIEQDKEEEMIKLNIESLYCLTKMFVEEMDEGIILNVSSLAAFLPTPLLATYAATKAFVLNFSLAVNNELKHQKRPIKIKVLCPGPVNTEFAKVAGARQGFMEMSPERCATIAIKGLEKRKAVIIPGPLMKFARFLVWLLPQRIILAASFRLQSKKE